MPTEERSDEDAKVEEKSSDADERAVERHVMGKCLGDGLPHASIVINTRRRRLPAASSSREEWRRRKGGHASRDVSHLFSIHSPSTTVFFTLSPFSSDERHDDATSRINKTTASRSRRKLRCDLVDQKVSTVFANSEHLAFQEFILRELCPSIADAYSSLPASTPSSARTADEDDAEVEKKWRWQVTERAPWFANRSPMQLRIQPVRLHTGRDTSFLHLMYSLYAGHSLDQILYSVGRSLSIFSPSKKQNYKASRRNCTFLLPNFTDVHPSRYLFFNLNLDLLKHLQDSSGGGCDLEVLPFFGVTRYVAVVQNQSRAERDSSDDDDAVVLWLPSNKVAFVQRAVCQDVARIALARGVRQFLSSADSHDKNQSSFLPGPSPILHAEKRRSIQMNRKEEVIAIIKSARQPNAFTARFFNLSSTGRDAAQRAGITLLPEDLSRAHRLLLISRSSVLIDSSGANREINTILMPSDSSSIRHRITLVHPEAEPFMQSLCGTSRYLYHGMGRVQRGHGPMIRRPHAVWTHVCPETANLDAMDWVSLASLIPTNISFDEEVGGQDLSYS